MLTPFKHSIDFVISITPNNSYNAFFSIEYTHTAIIYNQRKAMNLDALRLSRTYAAKPDESYGRFIVVEIRPHLIFT